MNILKKITQGMFILSLPIFLFTLSVSTAANCPLLYKYGFTKYNISQATGISETELERVAHELINYWNNGEKTLNITVIKDGQPFTLFNEREVGHLVDVKGIFRLLYQLLLGSFILLVTFSGLYLFLWRDRRLIASSLVFGSGLSIILMIILGVLAITDFQWLFWQFHLFSFTNDLWLLNPASDYLIMLFPEGFWFDAAMFCSGFKVLLALILGYTGWRLLRNNQL